MKPPSKFLLFTAVVFLFLISLIIVMYLLEIIMHRAFISLFTGAALGFINYIFGLGLAAYGLKKSETVFLISLWGGLLLRMLLMLSLVVICLKFLDLSTDNFIFSVLFFYVFFLISEIIYLNLRKS